VAVCRAGLNRRRGRAFRCACGPPREPIKGGEADAGDEQAAESAKDKPSAPNTTAYAPSEAPICSGTKKNTTVMNLVAASMTSADVMGVAKSSARRIHASSSTSATWPPSSASRIATARAGRSRRMPSSKSSMRLTAAMSGLKRPRSTPALLSHPRTAPMRYVREATAAAAITRNPTFIQTRPTARRAAGAGISAYCTR
jgi:hypothetical protein